MQWAVSHQLGDNAAAQFQSQLSRLAQTGAAFITGRLAPHTQSSSHFLNTFVSPSSLPASPRLLGMVESTQWLCMTRKVNSLPARILNKIWSDFGLTTHYLLEPLELHFICRHKNDPNQQKLCLRAYKWSHKSWCASGVFNCQILINSLAFLQ